MLVPIIWTIGAVAGLATGDYSLFNVTTPVVIAEAGWLFYVGVKRNGKGT